MGDRRCARNKISTIIHGSLAAIFVLAYPASTENGILHVQLPAGPHEVNKDGMSRTACSFLISGYLLLFLLNLLCGLRVAGRIREVKILWRERLELRRVWRVTWTK